MNLDSHKQQEIAYYDDKARNAATIKLENYKFYSSYHWLYKWLKENASGKRVLDYGCGTGSHTLVPLEFGAEGVIGIDLSEESLKVALENKDRAPAGRSVRFLKMDCENLEFPDNYFDIILNVGTFSSIDLNKALPHLSRVLKTDGKLIGIETLGHNPLFNFKRSLNVVIGIRTPWAARHIFKVDDFKRLQNYFGCYEAHYFDLLPLLFIPFSKIPGMEAIIKLLIRLDSMLLKTTCLKKYAFKVVFVLSKPNKKM